MSKRPRTSTVEPAAKKNKHDLILTDADEELITDLCGFADIIINNTDGHAREVTMKCMRKKNDIALCVFYELLQKGATQAAQCLLNEAISDKEHAQTDCFLNFVSNGLVEGARILFELTDSEALKHLENETIRMQMYQYAVNPKFGSVEMITLLTSARPSSNENEWSEILYKSCAQNNLPVVEYLIQLGKVWSKDYIINDSNLNMIMRSCHNRGQYDMLNLLLPLFTQMSVQKDLEMKQKGRTTESDMACIVYIISLFSAGYRDVLSCVSTMDMYMYVLLSEYEHTGERELGQILDAMDMCEQVNIDDINVVNQLFSTAVSKDMTRLFGRLLSSRHAIDLFNSTKFIDSVLRQLIKPRDDMGMAIPCFGNCLAVESDCAPFNVIKAFFGSGKHDSVQQYVALHPLLLEVLILTGRHEELSDFMPLCGNAIKHTHKMLEQYLLKCPNGETMDFIVDWMCAEHNKQKLVVSLYYRSKEDKRFDSFNKLCPYSASMNSLIAHHYKSIMNKINSPK
jgi:hypothetical protein